MRPDRNAFILSVYSVASSIASFSDSTESSDIQSMRVPFVHKSWENFYRRVEGSPWAALGYATPTPGLCIVNLCIIILKKNIILSVLLSVNAAKFLNVSFSLFPISFCLVV